MEDDSTLVARLQTLFEKLVGEKCNSVIFGKGTGSVVSLGFGRLKQRSHPLKNESLDPESRQYKSTINLLISCSWRLTREGRVSGGWRDSVEWVEPDSESFGLAESLRSLRDKKVTEVAFRKGTFDVDIQFDNGTCLQVFCDITNDYDADDNYSFKSGDEIFWVASDGELYCEDTDSGIDSMNMH